MPNPTPAERARTTVRLSPYLRVRTPGACAEVDLHGTDPDGSVVLVLAEDNPVVTAVRGATGDLPVLVDAADFCPVPVADRVRGRVRLIGWVHEPLPQLRRELALAAADRDGAGALLDIGRGRTVLYVDVVEVHVAGTGTDPDDIGAVAVLRPPDYAAARPDPLAGTEAALLGHLVSGHPAELRRLAALLPAELRDGAIPVALDRHGLVLRSRGQDVRIPFGAPVHCARELPARMRELLARAAPAPATRRA
ncbi:MAG TPA: DUF2470 domain-containing protein [Mycobacteriales bacterium]|nr:DUF2470 domain-containing protein [Mycobacteriales bacterium]